jgi:phospholipase/carboxylesterase
MPAERTIAGLRTLWAGGTDREGGGDGPLVALLHGYGANAADLFGLWRLLEVPRAARFCFPEAPIELAGMGFPSYAWWEIDFGRIEAAMTGRIPLTDLVDDVPAGLGEARAAIEGWLAALRAETPQSPIVLGGFSQGAMLSLDVALAGADPFAAVVLMSATYLNGRAWRARAPERRPPLRVFQSHGRQDPLLPFPVAEVLRQLLADAGHAVTFRPFQGVHEIPPEVLVDLGTFLRGLGL